MGSSPAWDPEEPHFPVKLEAHRMLTEKICDKRVKVMHGGWLLRFSPVISYQRKVKTLSTLFINVKALI